MSDRGEVRSVPQQKRKRPDVRAAEIRDAASEIALESGLSALTLRAVAAKAGVTSALVAHYCDGIDGLIAETFARIVVTQVEGARHAIPEGLDPLGRLGSLCGMFLGQENQQVVLTWHESLVMGRRNPALADEVKDSLVRWRGLFEEIISDGVAAGCFASRDTKMTAAQVASVLGGVNQQAMAMDGIPATMPEVFCPIVEGLLGIEPGALAEVIEHVIN